MTSFMEFMIYSVNHCKLDEKKCNSLDMLFLLIFQLCIKTMGDFAYPKVDEMIMKAKKAFKLTKQQE